MRPLSNLHCHSRFSDGKDSLEEMVQYALDKGFVSLGFSEHAFTPYDSDCCITQEDMPRYFAEIQRLRGVYGHRIELYTGLELDYFQPTSRDGLDFVIGSTHYLRSAQGNYYNVDHIPQVFEAAVEEVAGGNIQAMVRQYYRQVVDLAEQWRPDVLGHIDLIAKLNRDCRYYDPTSPWYRQLIQDVADRIAASGCIVEVNTGGMFRGYTTEPYPSPEFLGYLHARGVPVTISSDAHTAASLDFAFDQMAELLQQVGYRQVKILQKGSFVDVDLL